MQLDLFQWQKAQETSATVYRFPLARRAALIRQITAELLSRDERAGRKFWNAHIKELRRELRAAGLRSADIAHEVHDYTTAVRIGVLSSLPMSVSR